ncbi:hypothetical protein pb186bvf_005048 [Paramecium bursaria]
MIVFISLNVINYSRGFQSYRFFLTIYFNFFIKCLNILIQIVRQVRQIKSYMIQCLKYIVKVYDSFIATFLERYLSFVIFFYQLQIVSNYKTSLLVNRIIKVNFLTYLIQQIMLLQGLKLQQLNKEKLHWVKLIKIDLDFKQRILQIDDCVQLLNSQINVNLNYAIFQIGYLL